MYYLLSRSFVQCSCSFTANDAFSSRAIRALQKLPDRVAKVYRKAAKIILHPLLPQIRQFCPLFTTDTRLLPCPTDTSLSLLLTFVLSRSLIHLPFLSPDVTSLSLPLIYVPFPFPNTPPLPFPWYISLSVYPWYTSPPGFPLDIRPFLTPGILPPFTLNTWSSIFLQIHTPSFLRTYLPSLIVYLK